MPFTVLRQPPMQALLLIDLINTWEMPEGRRLLRRAHAALPRLARLRRRATAAGAPVLFVNDNFGQWRSDFRDVVARARAAAAESERIVDTLQPGGDDYFVLKPRHSGFFATPLDLLLQELDVGTLVLCGAAGDQCVLATASEALLRKYRVIVPRDTLVCASPQRTAAALAHFRASMDIPTPAAHTLRWPRRRGSRD